MESYLDRLYTLLLAYAIAGVAPPARTTPDSTKEATLKADSTEYSAVPLDVCMGYWFLAQRTCYQVHASKRAAWLQAQNQEEGAEWTSRFGRTRRLWESSWSRRFSRRGTPIGFRRWAHYTGLEHAPPICRAGQPLHRLRPARRSMARGSPRSCETARFHARNSKKAIASRKANALMGLISAEGLPRASGSVGHLGIVPMCAVPRSRSDGASSSSARISTKAATPALGSWHHEWPGSSCQ